MKSLSKILGALGLVAMIVTITVLSTKNVQGRSTGDQISIAEELGNTSEEPNQDNDKPNKGVIQIALLLDTSNSMDGLIEQAKSQLWKMVNELIGAEYRGKAPKVEIALYQYGNDNIPERVNHIQQITGFTDDLDNVSEKLFELTTRGGDEYCGAVIQTSLNQLEWTNDADNVQMIFIAGNEPFTQGPVGFGDAVTNAKEQNVIVNTIYCGNYEEGINSKWKAGAIQSGGEYMAIDTNYKTVYISTPYDDRIAELNITLNSTYIAYGTIGRANKIKQSTQDSNARSYKKENLVERAVTKSSRMYNNSHWDLVDAYEDGSVKLKDLKDKDLPEELKGKSEKEIEAFIKEKQATREAIQSEIQALNKERVKHIAEQKADTDEEASSLDNAILRSIRKQAEEKDFKWKD